MATFGGALYIIYNSALIESPNCIFENNSAKIGGGALHIQG
jgi:predicted outer membrane repeat protein